MNIYTKKSKPKEGEGRSGAPQIFSLSSKNGNLGIWEFLSKSNAKKLASFAETQPKIMNAVRKMGKARYPHGQRAFQN